VKEQTVEIKNTIKETSKKLCEVVCSNKQGDAKVASCHKKVTKAVKAHFKKVQTETKKALKTCGCTVKATHSCANSATATQTVTDCKSTYVKVCSKKCLSKHNKKVAKKTEKLATSLCKTNKACAAKVVKQTEKAVKKVNKKVVKVHIVKKVGVTTTQIKKAVQEKKVIVTGKKVAINKEVVEHKETEKKVAEHKDTEKKVVEHKDTEKKVVEHKDTEKKVAEHKDTEKTVEHKEHHKKSGKKAHHSKKVGKHHSSHSSRKSSCERKAIVACGNDESEDCKSCQKSFISLCIEIENSKRTDLVNQLQECDDTPVVPETPVTRIA